jgi:hypothetical protein
MATVGSIGSGQTATFTSTSVVYSGYTDLGATHAGAVHMDRRGNQVLRLFARTDSSTASETSTVRLVLRDGEYVYGKDDATITPTAVVAHPDGTTTTKGYVATVSFESSGSDKMDMLGGGTKFADGVWAMGVPQKHASVSEIVVYATATPVV